MMEETRYTRTENLIGSDGLKRVRSSSVLIFGLGGVGGICSEALCRLGVKKLGLVDFDEFKESNLNRQILCTAKDIGRKKVDVARERLTVVNSDVEIQTFDIKVNSETIEQIPFEEFDFVVDAIDDLKAKVDIIKKCRILSKKEIVCCGTGNNLFGKEFVIKDIKHSQYCPLAKKLRKVLKEEGIFDGVEVLFKNGEPDKKSESKNQFTPSSVFFAPNTAGIMLASKVTEWILSDENFK